jgi:NADH:ubiquinone oxidoreductase subunit F (NADH-binding)
MVPALSEHDAAAEGLAVGALPGFEPRLVAQAPSHDFDTPGLAGEALIAAVEASGLRGRGGAGFPAAVKLATMRMAPGPKYLVANGEEGEPASIKDRWLMRRRPHLVIDGALRAAEAIGAAEIFLYVSDPASTTSLRTALAECDATALPVSVFEVAPGYVAGEETAVVRALNGGLAKPTDKPPRPYQSGVRERPTLVSNVETLANIALIATQRAGGDSLLLTITGAVARPGLYEVPLGTRLGTALDELAQPLPGLRGLLMGGFFAGLLNRRALDLPLTHDGLREAGSGLGCGAIIVLGEADCPIAAAGDVMAYFARENAGQCGACFRGTPAMSRAIEALGTGDDSGLAKLKDWSVSLRGRGACGTLDGAAHLAATIFREFPDEVDRHRGAPCPRCRALLPAGPRTRFRAARQYDCVPAV